MKTIRLFLTAIAVLLCALIAIDHPIIAAVSTVAFLGVWLQPVPQLGTLTLILALLTRKVIAAFKTKVPPLSYISTDLGMDDGSLAPPVKFGQEIISHLALVPTVADHTPGEDLETGAASVADFLSDIYMKIDLAKKVVLKIPTASSVQYVLDGALDAAMSEGGMALGRAVLADVFSRTITPANFTQSMTETVANADFDTLRAGRVALNTKGALEPRFGITGSQFLSNVSDDPAVSSGDYYDQRTGGDPYLRLNNIEGFNQITEFPAFSADNGVLGTFTAVAATDVITVSAAHGLNIGDRVRVSSATTLPAGLAAATNYFVKSVPSTTTLTLSATNGGAVVDITDTGTGVHTIQSYGQLNGFLFERRAIHFASRQLTDNFALAKRLGIPQTIAHHTETDEETGLTFTVFAWMKSGTQDIYIAFTVAYGCKGGRGLAAAAGVDPGSLAEGAGMDYAGLRVIES